jgi:hypothetical protein
MDESLAPWTKVILRQGMLTASRCCRLMPKALLLDLMKLAGRSVNARCFCDAGSLYF